MLVRERTCRAAQAQDRWAIAQAIKLDRGNPSLPMGFRGRWAAESVSAGGFGPSAAKQWHPGAGAQPDFDQNWPPRPPEGPRKPNAPAGSRGIIIGGSAASRSLRAAGEHQEGRTGASRAARSDSSPEVEETADQRNAPANVARSAVRCQMGAY